jgi:prolyl-tRNA synthetase
VLEATTRISQELRDAGIRLKVDERDNLTPGFKFNDWELRGVPLRVEIGPRDVANHAVGLARRDVAGREGKQFASQDGPATRITDLLEDIQRNLLERATAFRDERTCDVTNYKAFQEAIASGFARVWWAGDNEDELKVKEETKATIRCFPFEQPGGRGTCFYTGKPADRIAIFGRSY